MAQNNQAVSRKLTSNSKLPHSPLRPSSNSMSVVVVGLIIVVSIFIGLGVWAATWLLLQRR